MSIDLQSIRDLVDAARVRGDEAVVGGDALAVASALGLRCPRSRMVHSPAEAIAADIASFGDRVVVKAISPRLLHKSEAGAVVIVANEPELVAATVDRLSRRLATCGLTGFLLCERIEYDASFGGELLVGARWTDEFGPVLTVGPGGVSAEFVAANLRADRNVAILSPSLVRRRPIADVLRDAAVVELATGRFRGRAPRLAIERLTALIDRFITLGRTLMPTAIAEFEINPLVESGGALVALDARLLLGHAVPMPSPRPIAKLRHLLTPERVAIVGVSEQMNPGRIILRNLLAEGFDPSHVTIVKPGIDRIDGCRAVGSIAELSEPVDLLVLSVGAAQAASIATEAIATQKAESLILIPGGFEEKAGGTDRAAAIRTALDAARHTDWRGPVVNGANCVGIRSRPGHYDTMFIPADRLPPVKGPVAPIAMIAQSGALALSMLSKLPGLNPKYCITVGNQLDLTIGDYLAYLKTDHEIDVFALYVEGFKPLDGAACMAVASDLVAMGRTVILYRGGRTEAGRRATSTHTASVAGDYAVTRALAREAGVIVADTLDDFEDLLKIFALLRGRQVEGWQLGAVSNAGFECVAFADSLGAFRLPPFSERTAHQLRTIFQLARVDTLVDVQNPLDLTPMLGDIAYGEVARAVLADEQVDVAIVGCVPMTPALNSVPLAPVHREPAFGADSIVTELVRLNADSTKAWIAVVDAGAFYDPMVSRLEAGGIPTCRTADRALRLFEIFCAERMRQAAAAHVQRGVDVYDTALHEPY